MTDQRTYQIIGAAKEVHKELGSGFLEAVYQEALEREFREQGIPSKYQPTVQIINYLKATSFKVGLLINFGNKSLEHKRFVYNL